MSIVAKVGERTYEFNDFKELTAAREVYAHSTGNQNEFEDKLEQLGIEVNYEL